MERWLGKVAIVTGAGSGIGAAIANKLICSGLKVVALGHRSDQLEELTKSINCNCLYPIKADITNECEVIGAINSVKQNIGPVHILVNNAGLMQDSTLMTGETAIWRKCFETNVIGLCVATREAIKSMNENKTDGHIIHINSIAGQRIIYIPHSNVYGATKYAVTNLAEILRKELVEAKSKIKITCICPGLVHSVLVDSMLAAAKYPTDLPKLNPEDIADAVVYSLSTPPHVQIHELTIKPVGEFM